MEPELAPIDPAPADPTPTPDPTPEPTPTNWLDSVHEDFRGDPGLKDVKNVSDLAKGYLSSQRMLGDRIKIPGQDAAPDDIDAFNRKLVDVPGVVRLPEEGDKQGFDELYAKLGRPETPEQYTYKTPELPEGMKEDTAILDWFKKSMHEKGASNDTVSKVLGEWYEMVIGQFNEQQKVIEQAEVDIKKEWGNDSPRRLGAARALINQYGTPELDQLIESSGLGNNLMFMKMMSDIGLNNLEDSAINKGLGEASETPAEINEKINELMNHPAYLSSTDPQHKDLVDKVFRMRQKLHA